MLKTDKENNKIYLHGSLDTESGDLSFTYLNFVDAFNALTGDEVSIYINSPGGIYSDGVAIYNLLKESGKKITTVNIGIAASAAAIIFLAGDKRIMSSSALLMYHNVQVVDLYGNKEKLAKVSSELAKMDADIENLVLKNSQLDINKLRNLMKSEEYITGWEAVDYGLATEYDFAIKAVACADVDSLRNSISYKDKINKINQKINNMEKDNIKEEIQNSVEVSVEVCVDAQKEAEVAPIEQPAQEPQVVDAEQVAPIEEVKPSIEERLAKLEEMVAELTAKDAQIKELEAKLKKYENKKAKVDAIVPDVQFANYKGTNKEGISDNSSLLDIINKEPDPAKRHELRMKNWDKLCNLQK